MQEARKSLIASLGIVAVIGAVVGGGLVRNRMEIGPDVPVGGSITMDSLVTTTEGVPGASEVPAAPISESTYFYQLTQLLEREYVDPIRDERALATGAIKGMVNSLADSESLYYKKDQFAALKGRRSGEFQGIGVEVRLEYKKEELRKLQNRSIGANGAESEANFDPLLLIPTVVVSTVVPGGPAEKAGIKVGDRILKIDKKWALSSLEVDKLRSLRLDYDEKRISADDLRVWTETFRAKFESAISPARAAERLVSGESGAVDLIWVDGGGAEHEAKISKARTRLPSVNLNGSTLTLRFFSDAPSRLESLKLPEGELTIDLRQSSMGDYDAMRKCLAMLAPTGEYGTIKREQAGATQKLTVAAGAKARPLTLIVDRSTWGAAAVFASALSGSAKIVGTLSDDLPWIEMFDLPDGSGYTLRTGTFVAGEVTK